jgi:hypothetical protein
MWKGRSSQANNRLQAFSLLYTLIILKLRGWRLVAQSSIPINWNLLEAPCHKSAWARILNSNSDSKGKRESTYSPTLSTCRSIRLASSSALGSTRMIKRATLFQMRQIRASCYSCINAKIINFRSPTVPISDLMGVDMPSPRYIKAWRRNNLNG